MDKRKRQTTQWTKEKDRQHNGQKKKTDNTMAKRKREKNDLQKTIQKTKDRVTRIPQKPGNSGAPEGYA